MPDALARDRDVASRRRRMRSTTIVPPAAITPMAPRSRASPRAVEAELSPDTSRIARLRRNDTRTASHSAALRRRRSGQLDAASSPEARGVSAIARADGRFFGSGPSVTCA